jgi:hypothetical protein
MSEALKAPQETQAHEQSQKYFELHLKAWTNFDPMQVTLNKIALGIEEGSGFLTLIEVLRVEDDVTSIDDEDVREYFENTIAAKRLIQNVDKLPKVLLESLRLALKTEEKIGPEKTVTLVTRASLNEESAAPVTRWP